MSNKTPSLLDSLEAMGRDALVSLVEDLAERYPDVRRDLLLDATPASGRIVALRREIEIAMAEGRGYDSWRGTGRLPDLAHVARQLRTLLAEGHADDVLTLCEHLWELAPGPLNECLDEGETAATIGECLAVAVEALPKSGLRPAEQICWEIDHHLADGHGVMASVPALAEFVKFSRADWREVADLLRARLAAMPRSADADHGLDYRRTCLLKHAVDALKEAHLADEVIPLLEAEADHSRCYVQLVDALIEAGRTEEARQWCRHGYAATADRWWGIAMTLQDRLQGIAGRAGQSEVVAAYAAKTFFDDPDTKTWRALKSAAGKAACWPAVREQVLGYLASGVRPGPKVENRKGGWPLPALEIEQIAQEHLSRWRKFPDLETLIDIAIFERRIGDVVELHGQLSTSRRHGSAKDQAVAAAVATKYPDISLAIWRGIVEGRIAEVKPKAYQQAVPFLRHMREVYTRTGRQDQWVAWLAELRREHRAKRRLIELLGSL